MENSMKKRLFLTMFAALTASGFIMVCAMGQSNRVRRVGAKQAAAQTEPAPPLYTVAEYEGRIAVFRRGMSEPCKYIDFDISLLSDYDREQLAGGIPMESEAELRSYIQDMTS